MMRRSWVLLAVAAAVLTVVGAGAGPASAATSPRCTVFAAASLYKAFPAMVRPFKARYPRYRNVKFDFSFQGTDSLVAQIELGATPDVFAGASVKYGNQLITDGFAVSQRLFCQNRLCVIVPAANSAGIDDLGDLARTTDPIPLIAIGNAAVPIGTYTQTVLANIAKGGVYGSDYADKVMANVAATVANVNMVTALVSLDEADAGFVYKSDRMAAGARVKMIKIDDAYQSNPLPTYPIATIKGASHPTMAARFITFVMSRKGQAILATKGFLAKPYPVIKSVTPTSGAAGSTITIAGTNFFPGLVKIGGVVATTSAWSATSITATVPDSLTAGDQQVTVTSDGRTCKTPATFTVTP